MIVEQKRQKFVAEITNMIFKRTVIRLNPLILLNQALNCN